MSIRLELLSIVSLLASTHALTCRAPPLRLLRTVEERRCGAPRCLTPQPKHTPAEIPTLLMEALARNDFPECDDGLTTVWSFASDTTRFIFKNNLTDFIESAHETAAQYPTSFYGNAFHGQQWTLEGGPRLCGPPATSWIATQMMRTISSDGRMRRWQWEMRKRRQPPNRDCWFVESIGSSDREGNFEID